MVLCKRYCDSDTADDDEKDEGQAVALEQHRERQQVRSFTSSKLLLSCATSAFNELHQHIFTAEEHKCNSWWASLRTEPTVQGPEKDGPSGAALSFWSPSWHWGRRGLLKMCDSVAS